LGAAGGFTAGGFTAGGLAAGGLAADGFAAAGGLVAGGFAGGFDAAGFTAGGFAMAGLAAGGLETPASFTATATSVDDLAAGADFAAAAADFAAAAGLSIIMLGRAIILGVSLEGRSPLPRLDLVRSGLVAWTSRDLVGTRVGASLEGRSPMRLVSLRTCESRVCCSSGPGSGGPSPMEAVACSTSSPPPLMWKGESIASASDVPGPDEGGTQSDLRVAACLGCAVTSSGGSDGLNLLGGVGAAPMGVGGAEVGVGGSDSDERKQTPVLAEEDHEGSCLAVLLLPLLAILVENEHGQTPNRQRGFAQCKEITSQLEPLLKG